MICEKRHGEQEKPVIVDTDASRQTDDGISISRHLSYWANLRVLFSFLSYLCHSLLSLDRYKNSIATRAREEASISSYLVRAENWPISKPRRGTDTSSDSGFLPHFPFPSPLPSPDFFSFFFFWLERA